MKMPSVTVLVDTYNYGRFIEEAIESVLSQDYPRERMEVLVVDDGSKDDTAQRVRKYGDGIQYLYKRNGGQASAFNYGLARAKGEIIAFLDADDYWLPGKLRRVVEEFERHPEVGLVYHSFREVELESGKARAGGFSTISGFLPSNRRDLLCYDLHPTSALSFRRSILGRLPPIPEELVIQADGYLSACIIFLAPVIAIPEELAVYRLHGQNLWYAGETTAISGHLQRRITTTNALGEGVRSWLLQNGFDITHGELRAFCMKWTLSRMGDEFRLSPPGRLTFFRFLLEYSRTNGARMTPRHKLVNYLNAFGSLVVGYKNYHRLDETRIKIKRHFGSILGKPAPHGE